MTSQSPLVSQDTARTQDVVEHPLPWRIQIVGNSAHVIDALRDTVTVFDQDDLLWPFIVQRLNESTSLRGEVEVLNEANAELLASAQKQSRIADHAAARVSRLEGALKNARECIDDLGSGRGGWAWEEMLTEINEALDHSLPVNAGSTSSDGEPPSPYQAWEVIKLWVAHYIWEQESFSRYRDHVSLDGIMTAADMRALAEHFKIEGIEPVLPSKQAALNDSLAVLDDMDHEYRLLQESPGGVITSRELIKRCGGDPDAPFERGPFPPEMRMFGPSETLSPDTARVADREALEALLADRCPTFRGTHGNLGPKGRELADAILSLLEQGGGTKSERSER